MRRKPKPPYLRPPNPWVRLRAKTIPDARKQADRDACRQRGAAYEQRYDNEGEGER